MSSRHLVDPGLWVGLEMMPTMGFSQEMLSPTRTMMAQMVASRRPVEHPDIVSVERHIDGPDGNDILLMVHRPRAAVGPLPAVLHIHGGGYVIGSAEMSVASNQRTAADVGCVVVSVDYRLAPETRHPGPVEDCWAALQWVIGQAAALDVDPARIAVMGESAGGGLAAALALMARDRGVAAAHQHLIYPMIDDRTSFGDPHPYTGEFVWTAESNRFGWTALLGEGAGGEGVDAYGAAARATDLTGLPPTYIAVGALDLFVEEDIDYARRLLRSGVPTELHVYPGAFHGFDIAVEAGVTKTAYRNSLAALRRALHPTEEARQ
ncbi:alpha/beta hydrolase [Sphingomonas sp. RT2P30]|uniref:alpha/beta hydrolase n=1 Tax=Parasphingomonas halimpatiens TaxID=3096162 RepID=UPI002FC6274B